MKLLLQHAGTSEQLDDLLKPVPEECWVFSGKTALQLAEEKGHMDIVKELNGLYYPNHGSEEDSSSLIGDEINMPINFDLHDL